MKSTLAAAALAASLALSPAASAQTVRIALQDDPESLDPAINWSFVGRHVLQSLCAKLVDIDERGGIVPALATAWKWSDGGKTLTLALRDGVVFHDGERFDAAAVKYSLERGLTMKTSRRRAEIDSIDAVETPDPRTVVIRLKTPSVPLLAAITDRAGMVVSPKAAEAAGENFQRNPVCSGPYRFVEWVAQDRIVLEKFPGHWRAADFQPERLVFQGIPDSTVRLTNLRAGQFDLIERLAPTDVAATATDKSLAITEAPILGYFAVTFNLANGPKVNPAFAQHRAVREAFSLALDRATINQVAFDGRFDAGNQPFPPASPWYNRARPVPKRDLAAAKAKLKEAGLEKVTLELLVPTDRERQQVAEIMQAMLAEAGITLKIQATELMSLLARAREGNFEAHLVGWSGRVDPDLNITPLLGCGVAGNDGRYCNRELDALLAEARAIADPEARKPMIDKAITMLLDDSPAVYLYHAKWIFAHRARLTGFRPAPDGIIRLDGVKIAN